MNIPEQVSVLLVWLKENYDSAEFTYLDTGTSFRKVANTHFARPATPLYGVYIVRQQSSGTIIYIGKGGTVTQSGKYKGQDILGRLINVRGDSISADIWFGEVAAKYGAITVEYHVLRPPLAPAFVEAALLQAFLSEFQELPLLNKSF